VVRELTAEKLRKERELLELAKEALTLEQGVVLMREPTDASYVTGNSDVSMASMSLSRSKVSGVFSSATATGLQVGGSMAPPGLVAPPPAGSLAPDSSWAKAQRGPERAPWIVLGLATLSVGALLWLWLSEPMQPIASELPGEPLVEPARALEPRTPAPVDPPALQPSIVQPTEAPQPAVVSDRSEPQRDARMPRVPRPPRPETQARPVLADEVIVNPYRQP